MARKSERHSTATLTFLLTVFFSTGKSNAWAKEIQERLKSSKLYLKTDYKLHIAEDSRCADHCRKHALSDAEPEFHEPCRHKHDVTCDRCEVLENTLTEIEVAISSEKAQLRYGSLASKVL